MDDIQNHEAGWQEVGQGGQDAAACAVSSKHATMLVQPRFCSCPAPRQVEMNSLLSGMAAAQEADVFVGVHGEATLRCAALCCGRRPCRGMPWVALRCGLLMSKLTCCAAACAMSGC